MRAHGHRTTVRALGVQNVMTLATLRSLRTQAESVYHVRGLGDGDSPTSSTKDTRLDEALDRILRIAEVIPIGLSTIRSAIALQRSRSLSPQDSIVYASILAHLAETSEDLRCFITKNSKDFVNPDIENDLATHTCRLLTKFGDGLGYIRSRL
jgi:predicted nucleic acid-binding protein